MIWGYSTGVVTIFFYPSKSTDNSKNHKGRNLKCQIFLQHFFKIVLYWCLDLIRHHIGTSLKHNNNYIFDISIPFCHILYLHVSVTFKQFLMEFAGFEILFHVVYM
jgi:hypothetical protein